ncbi:MAG: hypothetical protein EAZ42_11360 [Verrucomicrobia bacterium]|nr:MAG: hypothetical protein EAZ42_11360 [Verrucomicrobiota bacterium]
MSSENDKAPDPIAAVLEIAFQSSWIRLAIEKYEGAGGRLDYAQRSTLLKLTNPDVETLKREAVSTRGLRPGQDSHESGRIY